MRLAISFRFGLVVKRIVLEFVSDVFNLCDCNDAPFKELQKCVVDLFYDCRLTWMKNDRNVVFSFSELDYKTYPF